MAARIQAVLHGNLFNGKRFIAIISFFCALASFVLSTALVAEGSGFASFSQSDKLSSNNPAYPQFSPYSIFEQYVLKFTQDRQLQSEQNGRQDPFASPVDKSDLELKWNTNIDGAAFFSPLINGQKSIGYIAANSIDVNTGEGKGRLTAVNLSDGSIRWSFDINGSIVARPIEALDGTILAAANIIKSDPEKSSADGVLFAVDQNGKMKWSFQADGDIVSPPVIGSDARIFFGTDDKGIRGFIYAIDPGNVADPDNVRPDWIFETKGAIESSPLVTERGDLFAGTSEKVEGDDIGHLFAIDAKNGSQKWEFQTDEPILVPPIRKGNIIFVGTSVVNETQEEIEVTGKILAFDTDNVDSDSVSPLFSTTLKGGVFFSPLIIRETLFVSVINFDSKIPSDPTNLEDILKEIKPPTGSLIAINTADGSIRWEAPFDGFAASSPVSGTGGNILINTTNIDLQKKSVSGEFLSISPDGIVNREEKIEDHALLSSPAVDNSGNIYLTSAGISVKGGAEGRLTVINTKSGEAGFFEVKEAILSSPIIDINNLTNEKTAFFGTSDFAGDLQSGDISLSGVFYAINVEQSGASPLIGGIIGKVTDVETDKGVSGALISVANGVFTTETLSDGSYELTDTPEDIYTVEASLEGFVSETKELVAVLAGNTTTLDFVLTPSAPVAELNASVVSGPVPLTVDFSDKSTGRINERLWVFGDGGVSAEQNPTHTYERAGIFSVILTVKGPGGSNTIIKPGLINAEGVPIAQFESSATAGFAPLEVEFNDLSTGNITNWLWDFGDGNTSTEQNPSHTYDTEGLFTVTLEVGGPGGTNSIEKTNLIRVLPKSIPVAGFSANVTAGFIPLEVQFFDLSTGEITSRIWDFGDGGSSSEQSPLHVYNSEGIFNISLEVIGPQDSDTESKAGFIQALPVGKPRVEFSANPTAAFEPLTVRFTDLTEGAEILNWLWDFGDGGVSAERSPAHTYKTEGIFTPALTVNGRGGAAFKKKTNLVIAISKGSPVAEFTANPTVFFLPAAVNFTDLSEGDNIVSWIWNFGDGGISAERNPTHTYNTPGHYNVTLTVSNANGAGRETKTNLVNAVSVGEPLSEFNAAPQTGFAPFEVRFNELAEGDIDNFFWDFGDGATSVEKNPAHIYKRDGLFAVSLTVSGSNGANTRKKTNLINTQPILPPAADFTSDKTFGEKPLDVQFTDLSTGIIDSWLWLFGDGASSSEQNPSHTYNNAGIFFVSLTVSGPGGADIKTEPNSIQVASGPEILDAEFTVSQIIEDNNQVEVHFADLSKGNIARWAWDFGDRKKSREQNPVHIYKKRRKPAAFTIQLTVFGPDGSDKEIKEDFITVESK